MKSMLTVSMLGVGALTAAVTAPVQAQTEFLETAVFEVPEANQGVGVDRKHFYAVDDRTIAKYTKSGQFVAKWEGAEDGPIVHLDSATVVHGKIYCAHSNYRYFPMTSSVEVWDSRTMRHIASHSFGILLGSLTWLDIHNGHWYGAFANYNRTGRLPDGTNVDLPYSSVPELGNITSTIVKFDKDWQVMEGWVFPPELLERFEEMSNSGGSFGPDGRLYITGHDYDEIYKIRFPEAGSVLEVEEVFLANIRGQGIAWDPFEPGIIYGIVRATSEEEAMGVTNKVSVFQSNITVQDPQDWFKELYRDTP